MVPFKLNAALKACGGKYYGDESLLESDVIGVTIDSRAAASGFLFVPVKGGRFDGHDYIPAAREAGALCVITEKPLVDTPYILVESSIGALQSIAEYYRSLFSIPVVGITGSVGKTTTKELIARVLAEKYNVLKNEGNLNNQTGVPITVFRLAPQHEAAVIEMGTNHFGEIRSLAKIARPGICVLTNIGEAHLEFLGSKEGILKAKSEMLEYIEPGGFVVINGDDRYLATLIEKYPDAITYGLGEGNKVRAKDVVDLGLDGCRFTACFEGRETEITVPAPGAHMVLNALAALATGRLLGVESESIKQGIARFCPTSGRMDVIDTGSIKILSDAYNANPTSMAASICVAANAGGRCVCILGDMFELGENEIEYHRETGRRAAEEGADLLVCTGRLSKHIYEGAKEAGARALHFPDKETMMKELPKLIKKGDTVLVKASRGMRLETVADWLKENY